MTIKMRSGMRRLPPEPGDVWVRCKDNGNRIIEFVHPTEEEKEILTKFIELIYEVKNGNRTQKEESRGNAH